MRFSRIMLLAVSVSILFISGCAFWEDDSQGAKKPKQAPQAAGAPQMLVPQTGKNNVAKPVVDNGEGDMMVAPKQNEKATMGHVPPPPLPSGMVATGNVEARLSTLEKRVDVIDSTVNQMKPALLKLDLFDKGLDKAPPPTANKGKPVNDITTPKAAAADKRFMAPIMDDDGVSVVGEEEVASAPAPASPTAANKKSSSGGGASSAVQAIRMSDNAGKTRIVFDLSAPAEYSYDIDNGEKILVVSFPSAAVNENVSVKRNALVDNVDAMEDGAGSAYIFALKKSARIVTAQKLGPSNGSGHRVFFDIAPE